MARKESTDLLAAWRKKKEEEANWKPTFKSKKQREMEAEAKEKAAAAAPPPPPPKASHGPASSSFKPKSAIPTRPRAMEQSRDRFPGKRSREEEEARAKMEEEDARQFRERYMGRPVNVSKFVPNKKRRRFGAQKFNFDWDPNDDTSRPHDERYANRGRSVLPGEIMTDAEARRQADGIRQRDPETGEERARQFLESHERVKQQRARKDLSGNWETKSLNEMKQRDWRIFKENFGIATKGGGIPNPMRSWSESNLPQNILDIVTRVGYKEPTPIQRAAIPIALQARDLIGVAVTGSGKTAAFLLPLLVYISKLPPLSELNRNDGPYALILAPTRELALQIESEARKFATPLGFSVVSIVGGHSSGEQATALQKGAEIIVATPGRLVANLEERLVVFNQCCYVIMDEADRMIDQGFEEDLTKILDRMPLSNEKPDTKEAEDPLLMGKYLDATKRYRQTMMYTATMPLTVEKIAKKYLRRPAIVTIGNAGEAVETVEQRVEFVAGEDKRRRRLQEVLSFHEFKPPIIVFVNTQANCDYLAREIRKMGFSVASLHGGKVQSKREEALTSLRYGEADVLVATDVAGRGIDIPDISLVVNYSMASNIEAYTHRIGRTGRAGNKGVAITFLGTEDEAVLYDLKQIVSKSSISRVPEELRRHPAAQNKPTKQR